MKALVVGLVTIAILIQRSAEACGVGCLKCDPGTFNCVYCDNTQNFTLWQGTCAFTVFPNCEFYTVDGMCAVCQTGYFPDPTTSACTAVPAGTADPNCSVYDINAKCIQCNKNFYLTSTAGCQPVTQPITGCAIYFVDNPLKCSLCSPQYYLSLDQTTCFKKTNNNCMAYSNVRCIACQPGYFKDVNYYSEAIFNTSYWKTMENFKEWSAGRMWLEVPQCRSTPIKNCLVFENFSRCQICNPGYILQLSGDCMDSPVPAIPNCIGYSNSTHCINCTNGYYLANSTSCVAIQNYGNCSMFNSSASKPQCLQCLPSSYLDSSFNCVTRTISVNIQNCVQNSLTSDTCSACNSLLNLVPTADGSGCAPAIVNCASYDPSTGSSQNLLCLTCNPGYTYISNSRVCMLGSVPNCQLYDKNNGCNTCIPGFFLSGNICSQQPPITNCETYSAVTNYTCATCIANSYKFDVSNYCLVYTVILYCAQYYDVNTCSKCQDYYYLIGTTKCVLIPESYNCIEFTGGQCVRCLPNYFLNFGSCQLPSDYQLAYCIKNNIDGLISPGQFQCTYCQQNAIPLNLKGYYTCTNPQGAAWLTNNCLKYSNNKQGRIVCDRCAPGFFVYSGTCMNSCPPGTILYTAQVQGFDQFGQSSTNNFTVTGINVCDSPPSYLSNCLVVSPGAVRNGLDDSGFLSYPYVCQKCADGMIKVVGDSSGISYAGTPGRGFHTNNTDNFYMDEPIDMFAAFNCIPLATSNIYIALNSFNTGVEIANCELYHNPATSVFCCIKCKHGFSGQTFPFASGNPFGCIKSCNAIADCDATVFYKGWWRSLETVNVTRSILDMYLSCHKCATSTNIVTVVLNFSYGNMGTKYLRGQTPGPGLAQYYPMPVIFQLPTTPNHEYQYSTLRSLCSNGYSFSGGFYYYGLSRLQYYSYDYWWRQIGIFNIWSQSYSGSVYCSAFSSSNANNLYITQQSTFYEAGMSSINQDIAGVSWTSNKFMVSCQPNIWQTFSAGQSAGGPYQTVSNCALIVVNAAGIGRSTAPTSTTTNILQTQGYYCGACLPGFRPFDVNTAYQVPFNIGNCEAIPNCAPATKWVNFCSACNQGYIWFFNTTYQYIDYGVCVPFSTDPYCFAAGNNDSGNVYTCAFCVRGYVLNPDGVCDTITFPYCTDTTTYSPKYMSFKSTFYRYLSSQFFYLFPEMASCNKCAAGYVAVKATVDTIVCVMSSYIFNRNYVANSVFKSSNCLNFFQDTSGAYYCYFCKSGYIAASNGNCYTVSPLGGHNNCLWAFNATNCDVCMSGYVFVNGKCVFKAINFCDQYLMNKTATEQVCITCTSGYYSGNKGTVCLQGNVLNCLNYTGLTNCSVCNTGYQLLTLAGKVSYCIPIPTELKCLAYDFNFQDGIMKCSQCNAGYVNTNTGSFPNNYCLSFYKVLNCISYDKQTSIGQSSFNCTKCSLSYYLSPKTFTCFPRTKIDPNCRYLVYNKDKCLFCNQGYYVASDGLTCYPNPSGIVGCQIYANSTTCTQCTTGYFLSAGSCLSIGNSTVANCKFYSAPGTCIQCFSNFYLANSTGCQSSNATNCLVNSNLTHCANCSAGYGLKTDSNNITSCVQLTDTNCLNSTTVYPFTCNQCYQGYVPDATGVCQTVKKAIPNCLFYSAEGVCNKCNQTSILSVDQSMCVSDAASMLQADPNCLEMRFVVNPECVACVLGNYFDANNTCQPCPNNCAICNARNPNLCYLCMSGSVMNRDQICVTLTAGTIANSNATNSTGNSSADKTNVTPTATTSGIRRGILSSVLLLLFAI